MPCRADSNGNVDPPGGLAQRRRESSPAAAGGRRLVQHCPQLGVVAVEEDQTVLGQLPRTSRIGGVAVQRLNADRQLPELVGRLPVCPMSQGEGFPEALMIVQIGNRQEIKQLQEPVHIGGQAGCRVVRHKVSSSPGLAFQPRDPQRSMRNKRHDPCCRVGPFHESATRFAAGGGSRRSAIASSPDSRPGSRGPRSTAMTSLGCAATRTAPSIIRCPRWMR